MKRICAWCGKDMGKVESIDDEGSTHGICETCRQKMENEIPCSICKAYDWWYLKAVEEGRPGVWRCGHCHPNPNKNGE